MPCSQNDICNPKCRPNFLDSLNKGCSLCKDVDDTKKYYYFSNTGCQVFESCDPSFKLVYNSNPLQCVKSYSENLFEMKDFVILMFLEIKL